MSKIINFNKKMEVTNFFGFYVKDDASKERCYLSTTSPDIGFTLFIEDKAVAIINWFDHFLGQPNVTEGDIWTWILKECHKYTRSKVYIDSSDVDEELDDPLVRYIHSTPKDPIVQKARDIDDFFADSFENHIY